MAVNEMCVPAAAAAEELSFSYNKSEGGDDVAFSHSDRKSWRQPHEQPWPALTLGHHDCILVGSWQCTAHETPALNQRAHKNTPRPPMPQNGN